MAKSERVSAGLLLFRRRDGRLEVFLAHPGGPFWASRDAGAWSIPKGELAEGEEPLAAACREFEEETGIHPEGPFLPLGSVRKKRGNWYTPGRGRATPIRSGSRATACAPN